MGVHMRAARALAVLLAWIAIAPAPARAETALQAMTVVYVTASDCTTCRALEGTAKTFEAKWDKKITFVRLNFPSLRDLTDPDVWGKYVFIRDTYDVKDTTPRFYMLKNGATYRTYTGLKAFDAMDATLTRIAREN